MKRKKYMRNIYFYDINFIGQFDLLEDHFYVNDLEVCSSSLVTQDQMAQTACFSQIKYIFFQNFISGITAGLTSTALDFFFLLKRKNHNKNC